MATRASQHLSVPPNMAGALLMFAAATLWFPSASAAAAASGKGQSAIGAAADGPDPVRNLAVKMQNFMFRRDFVRQAEERAKLLQQRGVRIERIAGWGKQTGREEMSVGSMLMENAVPLEDYNAVIVAKGGKPIDGTSDEGLPEFMKAKSVSPIGRHPKWIRRHLDGEEEANDDDAGDDYYMDADYLYDFDGYSLKFATCQKVQRFSTTAVENGEYSALVTDDVVVLRMCPQRRCKSSYQYGCYSGYGEYAISVTDYLRVMMRYEVDKQKNLCGFCRACSYGTGGQYTGYSNYNGRRLDDNADDYYYDDYYYDGDDYFAEGGDDDAVDDDDNGATDDDDNAADDSACDTYADLCEDYGDWCIFDGQDDDDDEGGEEGNLDYLDYLYYFDCVQVEGNDKYDYWVSPRCDPYSSKITMGIFYDAYCSQYAGNELNLNEVTDIYFQNDIFEDFYSGECIECATNEYPPYFNANNNMCNKIYDKSAKCNTYFAYDLSNQDDDDGANGGDTGICAFTESIREGTYDATGQVHVSDSFSNSQDAVFTKDQKIFVAVSSFVCLILALYACYLHHEITNLLLKSLAHGHLIPGSIGKTRSHGSLSNKDESLRQKRSTRRGKAKKKNAVESDDSDWDRNKGEYA